MDKAASFARSLLIGFGILLASILTCSFIAVVIWVFAPEKTKTTLEPSCYLVWYQSIYHINHSDHPLPINLKEAERIWEDYKCQQGMEGLLEPQIICITEN